MVHTFTLAQFQEDNLTILIIAALAQHPVSFDRWADVTQQVSSADVYLLPTLVAHTCCHSNE